MWKCVEKTESSEIRSLVDISAYDPRRFHARERSIREEARLVLPTRPDRSLRWKLGVLKHIVEKCIFPVVAFDKTAIGMDISYMLSLSTSSTVLGMRMRNHDDRLLFSPLLNSELSLSGSTANK